MLCGTTKPVVLHYAADAGSRCSFSSAAAAEGILSVRVRGKASPFLLTLMLSHSPQVLLFKFADDHISPLSSLHHCVHQLPMAQDIMVGKEPKLIQQTRAPRPQFQPKHYCDSQKTPLSPGSWTRHTCTKLQQSRVCCSVVLIWEFWEVPKKRGKMTTESPPEADDLTN